jgi:hypothetical protein
MHGAIMVTTDAMSDLFAVLSHAPRGVTFAWRSSAVPSSISRPDMVVGV